MRYSIYSGLWAIQVARIDPLFWLHFKARPLLPLALIPAVFGSRGGRLPTKSRPLALLLRSITPLGGQNYQTPNLNSPLFGDECGSRRPQRRVIRSPAIPPHEWVQWESRFRVWCPLDRPTDISVAPPTPQAQPEFRARSCRQSPHRSSHHSGATVPRTIFCAFDLRHERGFRKAFIR